MERNYLPVSLAITLIGLALIFLPSKVEVYPMDELVTLWNETAPTIGHSETLQSFSFRTGAFSITDGYGPWIEIINMEDGAVNATIVNIAEPETMVVPQENASAMRTYLVEDSDSYDMEITGLVEAMGQVNVSASFYHWRHTPMDTFVYYPFRFFGLGMTAIGLIATGIFYYMVKKRIDVSYRRVKKR